MTGRQTTDALNDFSCFSRNALPCEKHLFADLPLAERCRLWYKWKPSEDMSYVEDCHIE